MPSGGKQTNPERNAEWVQLYESGKTYREIAELYGVPRYERVRDVYQRHLNRLIREQVQERECRSS